LSALSDMDTPDHALAPESTAADVGGSIDWSRNNSGGSFSGSGDFDPMANSAADVTLSEHIQSQMALLKLSDKDRLVANYLAGQVDDAGYLRMSVEEASDNLGIGPARVSSVLLQLQTLEPTGLFATSLSHCLSLQLREMDALDAPMQTLVYIRETPHGGWAVELNADTLPRVLVNKRYYNEIKKAGGENEAARSFISECHADANWLVKSLDQRARTILKVSSEIVKQQDSFFAFGIDHLRPLKLRDVADAIDMHESTVSRVTSGKYMHTPRGLVSDDKMVKLLRDQGIDIARRTVAKYRESMGIPSSVERRRIFKHAQ